MAIAHIQKVFDAEGLSPSEKLYLLALTNFTDTHGYCYPGVKRLCAMTGLARASVSRIRRDLIDRNLLVRHRRGAKTNLYRVNLGKLETMAAPAREDDDTVIALEFADEPAPAPVLEPRVEPVEPAPAAPEPWLAPVDDPAADAPDAPSAVPPRSCGTDPSMSHHETSTGLTVRHSTSQHDPRSFSGPSCDPASMQRADAATAPSVRADACLPAEDSPDNTDQDGHLEAARKILENVQVPGLKPSDRRTVVRLHKRRVAARLAAGWNAADLQQQLESDCGGGRLYNPAGRLVKAISDAGDPPDPTINIAPTSTNRMDGKPPWCGNCDADTARWVPGPDGRLARCPDCHPAMVTAPAPAPVAA